uniref:Uncharacterized protein n=1 Tax=Glossina palpalis gambiensis TaxID=67801 RepID=A0A1B0C3G2_9MUSC
MFCYIIGGQITCDRGEKSYATTHLDKFENIVFLFDDTSGKGSNDYGIYIYERARGIKVNSLEDAATKVVKESANYLEYFVLKCNTREYSQNF